MVCCKSGSVMSAAVLVGGGALLGVTINEAASPTAALPTSAQPEQEKDRGEMSPEQMMAEWMRLGTPGEHHEKLDYFVGEWDADSKFMMAPDAPPMQSDGWLKSEWILDGRFVRSHFHLNNMMGQPFDGYAFVGYDNGTEEYVSVWMDSMSTKVFVHEGRFEGDSFITQGENGMGGEMRIVSEQIDEDTVRDVFYERQSPEAEWVKSGETVYTRR